MTYFILTLVTIRDERENLWKEAKGVGRLTLNLILTNGIQSLNVVRDMITRNNLNFLKLSEQNLSQVYRTEIFVFRYLFLSKTFNWTSDFASTPGFKEKNRTKDAKNGMRVYV